MALATSRVLDVPAATPEAAALHFRERLALETDPSDVHADMAAGVADFTVVDVRSRDAFAESHVPGAVSLPYAEIDETVEARIPRDRLAVVYCWGTHCNAAHKGAARLAALGYSVKEMIGGIDGWVRDGLPVARGDR